MDNYMSKIAFISEAEHGGLLPPKRWPLIYNKKTTKSYCPGVLLVF
jgi:hypothetical protein